MSENSVHDKIGFAVALIVPLLITAILSYMMGKIDGAREASRNHVITCNTVSVIAVESGIRARCEQ